MYLAHMPLRLALLRLDGDIYDSTADVLYQLCNNGFHTLAIFPLHSRCTLAMV